MEPPDLSSIGTAIGRLRSGCYMAQNGTFRPQNRIFFPSILFTDMIPINMLLDMILLIIAHKSIGLWYED